MASDTDIWLCPHCGEANSARLDELTEDEAVAVDCRACRRPSRLVLEVSDDGDRGVLVTNG